MSNSSQPIKENSVHHVLIASLIGTTIEFFDFYIYATAAVLVFPKLFFPSGNPSTSVLQSLATFALAFLQDLLVQLYLGILVIGLVEKPPWLLL